MFIDSHCHIDFPQLIDDFDSVLYNMRINQVKHALVVSVNLKNWPNIMKLVKDQPNLSASVGIHPGYKDAEEASPIHLAELAQHPKVIAIGETGLDYYRLQEPLNWQRERFERHLEASKIAHLPSIIHTRNAAKDTISMMREARVEEVGGVMHCFTETKEVAKAALDLNFYISFSGIITFKNAKELQDVVKYVPLEKMLIETDAPYLAPEPYRGKTNQPAYVRYVAECIAELKKVDVQTVAKHTSNNFYHLFSKLND